MASIAWSPEEIAECIRLRDSGIEWAAVGEALDRPSDSARRVYKREKKGETTKREFSESGDDASVWSITTKPIKTLEDAIAAADVDLETWFVKDCKTSAWTTPLKVAGEGVQTQQYRVALNLKRIAPKAILKSLDLIFDRIAKHAPEYHVKSRKREEKGCLCVAGLYDVHFGKLGAASETGGKDYDLKIAERRYANAIEDIIERSSHRNIQSWLLPIGQDLFNSDNDAGTTTGGTPQDNDSRQSKVYATAKMSVIRAIEKMMSVGEVYVYYCPGNHDRSVSLYLTDTIKSWFRNADNVNVITSSAGGRNYHRYGTCLIGLTHGEAERIDSLPGLMSGERRTDWAECECREWLIGHYHQERKYVSRPTTTQDSCVIRALHALSGTDQWHARKGFVFSKNAAEALYYDTEQGYMGNDVVIARDN